MKYLLVLLVVVIGLWLLLRSRGGEGPPPTAGPRPKTPRGRRTPDAIVACAHCGVHLPDPEAVRDADGRAFCTDAHRLAGPR